MSLADLTIDSAYETLSGDPVSYFYVPALSEAVRYDRIAGFFSSSCLALAARGVAGLIRNGGTMRLIVSPNLSEQDVEAIRASIESPEDFIERSMLSELDEMIDNFERDHVRALGWMLSNGLLEMRIAFVLNDDENASKALFHQKVGIIEDSSGNKLSFSGSINESASGWLYNSEEFKVFKSWVPGDLKFLNPDESKFDEFWNNLRPNVKVITPSEAFEYKLIELGEDFDVESITLEKYKRQKKAREAKEKIPLFFYQSDAVERWLGNDRRLLFEMATGTGKTRTAIACVNTLVETERNLVCVIATPEVTLTRQWEDDINALGVAFDSLVFCDSSSGGKSVWLPRLNREISKIKAGRRNNLLVLTTHDTACSDSLLDIIGSLPASFSLCFVGDEVHGLGAPKRRRALLDRYDFRIGLSATPARWFDEEGTALLVEYFGGCSFEFTIRDAQNTVNPLTGETFLTPYVYQPLFFSLDGIELDDYIELTDKIAKLSFFDDDDVKEKREKLQIKRADIVKNASAKIPMLERLIKREYPYRTLIFTSPEMIDDVCVLLASHAIPAHRFTMEQGTRKSSAFGGVSERQSIIHHFKDGHYDVLVAISCLDEGIDIPVAEKAILMSSSSNPREYIQRIGRVIRRSPGKTEAIVYDFLMEPCLERLSDPVSLKYEKKAFSKELKRASEMAENAINSYEVLCAINERLERVYGLQ